jgi:flagellar hook-length control protein FliK
MVTSLPAMLKAGLPAGLLTKSQAGDLETLQDLSFGELLKAKEKQLQHEQEINAASVSAALAAMQLKNMPVSTSGPLPELGTGSGAEVQPAAQAATSASGAVTQPWTTAPVIWAETGPETLATASKVTGETLSPTTPQAEATFLAQLAPVSQTAPALPADGTTPVMAAPIWATVSPASTVSKNPGAQVTGPAETASQPSALPAPQKPGVDPEIVVLPASRAVPEVATPAFVAVSPSEATMPAETTSQPALPATPKKVGIEPKIVGLPASGAMPEVAVPMFATVSPAKMAVENPGAQVTVPAETISQPSALPAPQKPGVEPKIVTLPASGTTPAVAAPNSATVSPAKIVVEKLDAQVTVPAETISQPSVPVAPEKPGVEPEIVALPARGNTPTVATPISATVSPTQTVNSTPSAPVSVQTATTSQTPVSSEPEKPGLEPKVMALPTSGTTPIIATLISDTVSSTNTVVETPGSKATVLVETTSQLPDWPTPEIIGVEPQIVASPASGITPVVAAPMTASVSSPHTAVENPGAITGALVESGVQASTAPVPEKPEVEPQILASPASGILPVVAALPMEVVAENPGVIAPAEMVSQPATWPTPKTAELPADETARVVAAPLSATLSPTDTADGNPGVGVSVQIKVSNLSAQERPVDQLKAVELPVAGTTKAAEIPVSDGVPSLPVTLTIAPADFAPAPSEFEISLGQKPVDGEAASTSFGSTSSAAQADPRGALPVFPSAEAVKVPPKLQASQTEPVKIASEAARPAEKQLETNPKPEALPAVPQPVSESVTVKVAGKELTIQVSEIIRQIAPQLNARIQSGPTSLRLQLNPKELGAIEVQMVTGPHGVSVTFFAEQASTGRLLETQMNQLRQSLTEAGIQLSDLNIGQQGQPRQEGGSFNQHSQFAQPPQPQAASGEVKLQETLNPVRTPGQWSEVDYLA